MIPLNVIRQEPDRIRAALNEKGESPALVESILAQDTAVRALLTEVEGLQAQRNTVSREIGRQKREGADAAENIAAMAALADRIKALNKQLQEQRAALELDLLQVPNTPHRSVPAGTTPADNRPVSRWGDVTTPGPGAKDQHDLLVDLALVDFEAGARITGQGFPVYTGRGAKLERALLNFMLDLQTAEHGYLEVLPPYLASRASTLTTGQLPKLEEDMYRVGQDDLFLIPTAEVPLTNLHRGQVLEEAVLPLKYVAASACFRREAGSYGKDTRGLLRVHQFNKVELVKFVHPDLSYDELESLRENAETVLRRLGLPYRVVELCRGDLSFAAAKCYDLELHAPVTGRWLEVSSCSNFEAFQARRGNIRFRRSDTGKLDYPHTLNGSGVATPRLLAALLENGQQPDGSVRLPEALQPYFGAEVIEPL